MNEDVGAIVRRCEPSIDAIDGLITLQASKRRILALIVDESHAESVRVRLAALGVPTELTDTLPVERYLIPYPTDDPRLRPDGPTGGRQEGETGVS